MLLPLLKKKIIIFTSLPSHLNKGLPTTRISRL